MFHIFTFTQNLVCTQRYVSLDLLLRTVMLYNEIFIRDFYKR